MFTVGAFAIIFDEQRRVLLCHRRDIDRWNLPGGGIMHGETPWQGVVREVKAEPDAVHLKILPELPLTEFSKRSEQNADEQD